jgi:putative membrane protein
VALVAAWLLHGVISRAAGATSLGFWLDLALLLVVVVLALCYARTLIAAARRVPLVRDDVARSLAYLATGTVTAGVALVAPVLVGSSLAPHVTIHALIGLIAPPFFLLALPRQLAWDIVPTSRRKRLVRALTHPIVAALLFETFLLVAHTSGPYVWLTATAPAHVVEHLLLLGLGMLFWWPVVEPLPVWGSYGWLWKVVYLFVSRVPLFALGIALLFPQHLLFSLAVFSSGLPPVLEQQLAGGIVVIVSNLVLFVALAYIVLPRLAAAARE